MIRRTAEGLEWAIDRRIENWPKDKKKHPARKQDAFSLENKRMPVLRRP